MWFNDIASTPSLGPFQVDLTNTQQPCTLFVSGTTADTAPSSALPTASGSDPQLQPVVQAASGSGDATQVAGVSLGNRLSTNVQKASFDWATAQQVNAFVQPGVDLVRVLVFCISCTLLQHTYVE